MKTAVVYTRVSTDEQADNGTSLAAQRAALLRLAASLNARVVAELEEAGISGGLFEARPGLQAALRLIESGQADLLLVHNISRLSRDREHQSIIKRRVEAAGGRLVFADMNFDPTPEGDLAFGIMGNFAHYERQLIRKRTMGGRKRRAEEGIQPTRSRSPYGYRIVNHKDVYRGEYPAHLVGTYLVREDQAQWVREIFARIASGVSLRQTCFWLEEQGVPTPRGAAHWDPKTLHTILKNTVYKGIGVFGRLETRHDETLITEKGRKLDTYLRIRPEDEWVTFPVPALVETALWEAAQERLRQNRDRLSGNPRRKFLLTSLVRCPVCGYKMAGAVKTDKRGKKRVLQYRYYICHPLRNGCPEKYFPAEALEKAVLEALVRASRSPDLFETALRVYQAQQRTDAPTDVRARRQQLETERELLLARERKIADAQVTALMEGRSTEVYDRMLADIDKKKAAVRSRLRSMPADPVPESEPELKTVAAQAAAVLRRAEEVLHAGDVMRLAERQAVLTTIVDRVIPGEGSVEIQVKSETVNSVWSESGCMGLSEAAASASATKPR